MYYAHKLIAILIDPEFDVLLGLAGIISWGMWS